MIKRETRKDIADHLTQKNLHFSGKMTDVNFLNRLYDLNRISSPNHNNAREEISGYEYNGNYYKELNWVFDDPRFFLLDGDNENFLKFICLMAHPLVRDKEDSNKIISITNEWLKDEGWELYPERSIAGGNTYNFRRSNGVPEPSKNDIEHIWSEGKLRFFISHRDIHKVGAKQLGEDLKEHGISSFVAHDSIQPMSTWKHEIMKALQTMDACICYITNDFYESVWTNQEVGFAIARGIPVYLYSVDRADPRGFKLDTQAIKSGFPELVSCIKKDFQWNPKYKHHFLHNFAEARDGNWDYAKDQFYNLIGFDFNDNEIEFIVNSFARRDVLSTNQLSKILTDMIKPVHKNHPKLKDLTYYREYLDRFILQKHSKKLYRLVNTQIVRVEGSV